MVACFPDHPLLQITELIIFLAQRCQQTLVETWENVLRSGAATARGLRKLSRATMAAAIPTTTKIANKVSANAAPLA